MCPSAATFQWSVNWALTLLPARLRALRRPWTQAKSCSTHPTQLPRVVISQPARAVIGVLPASALQERKGVLDFLEQLFPVRFAIPFSDECAALLVLDQSALSEIRDSDSQLPLFLLRSDHKDTLTSPRSIEIVGKPLGQPYLEGSTFELHGKLTFGVVTVAPDEKVVMQADGLPLWVEKRSSTGQRFTVVGALPEAKSNQPAVLRLIENRWLQLVPLLDFLATVTAPFDWDRPLPRACLMFDDPNLHMQTWGFINFLQLAQHAEEHNYHAAMAMVPLDTWFTNGAAAHTFRRHKKRLSLLVHGTYHTHAELIQKVPAERRASLLWEGLRRIKKFEDRSGVAVSRVMAPPHHACSVEACELLLRTGYAAACVSWNSLVRWNQGVEWSDQFGLLPSELLAEGFPVVPRFNFAAGEHSRVFLAALLRQPVIMIGHHWDLAEGYEPLAQAAETVNRLGTVEWSDMATVLRGCWLSRRLGRTLVVRMHAREVDVAIPAGVETVVIERPWMADDFLAPLQILAELGEPETLPGAGSSTPIGVKEGMKLRLRSPVEQSGPTDAKLPSCPRFMAYARRFACEARDRAMPYFKALRRG